MPLRRLYVVTFGCQMSAADGEELSMPLIEKGVRLVQTLEEADAVIVNTCTVRQHAEDRALSYLGRLAPWKLRRPEGLLVVAGCAAQRLGGWLRRRFPHVDLVVGAQSIESYPEILEEALSRRIEWTPGGPDPRPGGGLWPSEAAAPPEETAVSAYVTVMRGCNYSCSYCIVPAVRGRERYRPFDAVLAEARRRCGAGGREITLLGQTVNSYRSEGRDFADLLRAVGAIEGVERVRFMSPHPYFVGDRMIAAMAETPAVCPHLHLPVQSGSDRVLRRMRRNYSAADYRETIARLRAALPGAAVSTDFIVGFPGETEADFEETLGLAREIDFAFSYCFVFSPRDGTEAAAWGDPVPSRAKQERLQRLLAVTEASRSAYLARQVGRRVRVLLENETDGRAGDSFHARLEQPASPGALVDAVVTAAAPSGLRVRASNSLDRLAAT